MPRAHRKQSRVRFNLPLRRENTAYSDTSSHIRILTEEEIDIQDERLVADWLLTDGRTPARPYRMHVSEFQDPDRDVKRPSIVSIVGPLPFQLLFGGLEMLDQIPHNEALPPVPRAETQSLSYPSKLKRKGRFRSDFTHPDGTPISYHHHRAFFNDDEQEYIIPPSSSQPELRITVTKDWSSRKVSKQCEDQLLIYRVPKEHQLFFGMTVSKHRMWGVTLRKPEDDDDVIRVVRHGHPSWDVGFVDESWYLIGKNPHVVSAIYNRVVQLKASLYVRMKRSFWRTFGGVRSPAASRVLS